MSKFKIQGHIWIENSSGHLIGPGRKKLLEAIKKNGSIKLAAKAMGMSYRHAWEMVNALNKASKKIIVKKNTGGTNGGGSTITKEGEKLIAIYEKLQLRFEAFKNNLNNKTTR